MLIAIVTCWWIVEKYILLASSPHLYSSMHARA